MNYSDKIKAIQFKAGVEQSGIATTKTWISIYSLVFTAAPYQNSVEAIIKAIQEKIYVKASGKPTAKTWDALYELLIGNETIASGNDIVDPHNEIILQNMSKELAPFAKELIRLANAQGIQIRLINCEDTDSVNKSCLCNHQFGLSFEIWIFDKTSTGDYIYNDNSPLYNKVAKLGESIGLTWAGKQKTFTSNLPHFELRPAWAVAMNENDMVKELCRRKRENLSLLAIL